jgi:hypothetical protein
MTDLRTDRARAQQKKQYLRTSCRWATRAALTARGAAREFAGRRVLTTAATAFLADDDDTRRAGAPGGRRLTAESVNDCRRGIARARLTFVQVGSGGDRSLASDAVSSHGSAKHVID